MIIVTKPVTKINRLPVVLISCLLMLALLLSACGSDNSGSGSTGTTGSTKADVQAPKDLLAQGTLTIGTDPTYFPMEYSDPNNPGQYTGFDIELAQALANHMGLKLQIQNTNFDTIFNDLNNKRFDIIVASVYVSPERQQKYDFVQYMKAGSALLAQQGNPKHLQNLKDLCGVSVAVQNGTAQAKDLNTANSNCTSGGKPQIKVLTLTSATDVVQALANNRVDAAYMGSLSAGYYSKQNSGKFEQAGPVVDSAPSGIVIRKGDSEMLNAVQKAFEALKADGTYDKLFEKYGFTSDEKL